MKYGAVGVLYGESQVAGVAEKIEPTAPEGISLPAVSICTGDRKKIAAVLEKGENVVVTIMPPGLSLGVVRIIEQNSIPGQNLSMDLQELQFKYSLFYS